MLVDKNSKLGSSRRVSRQLIATLLSIVEFCKMPAMSSALVGSQARLAVLFMAINNAVGKGEEFLQSITRFLSAQLPECLNANLSSSHRNRDRLYHGTLLRKHHYLRGNMHCQRHRLRHQDSYCADNNPRNSFPGRLRQHYGNQYRCGMRDGIQDDYALLHRLVDGD